MKSNATEVVTKSLSGTLFGTLHVGANVHGICSVTWGDDVDTHIPAECSDTQLYVEAASIADLAIAQLGEYFSGLRQTFDLPLHLNGTPFQCDVWRALLDIPYGATRTYGDIAQAIGRGSAVRAVGQANRRNPVPVIVPCHRVVGSGGALTGYAGSQVHLKAQLLQLEQSAQVLSL